MTDVALPRRPGATYLVPAALMLAATWLCHLPLMLWDHLDLVPIYQAWQEGRLAGSAFWQVHDGSHLHTAAYAILLFTTWLSGGRPWLDCLASWLLLAVQAWLLLGMARRSLLPRPGSSAAPALALDANRCVAALAKTAGLGGGPCLALRADGRAHDRHSSLDATLAGTSPGRGWWCALVLLAWYPGHLVNLQWGWQVAVFVSLLGAVAPVYLLTAPTPGFGRNLAALAFAVAGVLGFSTTLAVFPIAVGLIALRTDHPYRRRVGYAVPWLVVLAALLAWLSQGGQGAEAAVDAETLVPYALNYLGSGILRFADDLAPVWAAVALLTGAIAAVRSWRLPQARPWLALMLFGVGCAVLTAFGRAGSFGADHAFASRYVSFASLFWIGWLGAMLAAFRGREPAWRRWARPLAAATMVLAAVNGIHMIKQAVVARERAEHYAAHVREHYPALDPAVLEQAYADRAHFAQERLRTLHGYGFAPFVRSAPQATVLRRKTASMDDARGFRAARNPLPAAAAR